MTNLPSGTVTLLFTDIEGSMELAREVTRRCRKRLLEANKTHNLALTALK